ncbi:MAG: ATP-binding cassette domain-containing protein [Proteobacteria bacterium]|nr:ATP-binding cassette domain-containing protein [Pseudomonadota bacterium]
MEKYDVVLDSVTKRFGSETAVDGLSLNVPKGEYLCMLGPSGCGKTTTLRMISGFLRPDQGNIYLNEELANDIPPHQRSTSIVFQSFALFPHLNVQDNVAFGLKMRHIPKSERRSKVDGMLERMGLTKMATKRPEELSMGERQRVALAKSLIIEPRVLLLDEPLSNIDVTLKNKILMDIRLIHDRLGLTFIHVTHDPEEAMANADRILLMNKGKIEQLGRPGEIFDMPKNRFVAEFFQNSNIIDGVVERSQGERIFVDNDLGRFEVFARQEKPPLDKKVSIVIRHDKVRLGTGKETENRVEGSVIGEEIVGAVITYVLRLKEEKLFKFQTHMSLATPQLQPEQKVTVVWDTKDAILLT